MFCILSLLLLGGLGLLPRILWRCLRGATYHRDLAERLGYGLSPLPTMSRLPAAAYGFTPLRWEKYKGYVRLLPSLHTCVPELPIVLSVFTPAGKHIAQRIVPEAVGIFVLPLDLPWLYAAYDAAACVHAP